MNSILADLEANYNSCYMRHLNNPTYKGLRDLIQKQITIDDLRRQNYMPLRWYTKKELKELVDTEEVSLPEKLSEPCIIPKDDTHTIWAEKTNYVLAPGHDAPTLTLDAVIQKLTKLREELGGDAPVFLNNIIEEEELEVARIVSDDGSVLIS